MQGRVWNQIFFSGQLYEKGGFGGNRLVFIVDVQIETLCFCGGRKRVLVALKNTCDALDKDGNIL